MDLLAVNVRSGELSAVQVVDEAPPCGAPDKSDATFIAVEKLLAGVADRDTRQPGRTGLSFTGEHVSLAQLLPKMMGADKILVSPSCLDHPSVHSAFFAGVDIYLDCRETSDINPFLHHPMVHSILVGRDKAEAGVHVKGGAPVEGSLEVCHIDASNLHSSSGDLASEIYTCWAKTRNAYAAVHIYNLPPGFENDSAVKGLYERISKQIGEVAACAPVNAHGTTGMSRDIKWEPNSKHFFSSSSRQPLHNDYAYYPTESKPEWLMLYCLAPSEIGGTTYFTTTSTIIDTLRRVEPDLLSALKTEVVWNYQEAGTSVLHSKPILDDSGRMNWNYFQLDNNLNPEIVNTKDRFFEFLEDSVVGGLVFTFQKKWQKGDCILLIDSKVLHGRSSFAGHRWLKDHAIKRRKSLSPL